MRKFFDSLGEVVDSFAPMIKIILFILGTMIVLNFMSEWRLQSERERFDEAYRTYQLQSQRALKYSDSLLKEIAMREAKVVVAVKKADSVQTRLQVLERTRPTTATLNILRSSIDSLKNTLTDSVEMARIVIPAQDTLISIQRVTIGNLNESVSLLKVETTFLRTAIGEQRLIIEDVTLTADSLRKVVVNMPKPPKKERLLGFIPLPSRTASFLLGAATTTIVVGVLSK